MSTPSSELNRSGRKLSARQVQMLKLAAEGYTDKEMAVVLGISAATVTTYWKRLKSRFEGHSRTSLVVALIGKALDSEDVPPAGVLTNGLEGGATQNGQVFNPHKLLEELGLAIMFETDDRKISYANPAFLRIFSLTSEEESLIGLDCRSVLQSSKHMFFDAAEFNERIEAHISSKLLARGETVRLSDGRVLEYDYSPIVEGRKSKGHLWTFRETGTDKSDISAKVTEPDRAIQMIERQPIPRFLLGTNSRIEYLNPAAERMFKLSLDKVKSMSIFDVHQAFSTSWFQLLWQTTPGGQYQRHAEGELLGVAGWFQASITNLNGGKSLSIRDKTNEYIENRLDLDSSHLVETIGRLAAAMIGASAEDSKSAIQIALQEMSEQIDADFASLFAINYPACTTESITRWATGSNSNPIVFSDLESLEKLEGWPDELATASNNVLDLSPGVDFDMVPEHSGLESDSRSVFLLPLVEGPTVVGYLQFESRQGFRLPVLSNRAAFSLLATCCLAGLKLILRN